MQTSSDSRCPNCGGRIVKNPIQCPHCRSYLLEGISETPNPTEPKHDAWTQGMAVDFRSNGEFEATEYDKMPLSIALRVLRDMPALPNDKLDDDYCPPHLGFGPDFTISRFTGDEYLVFPGNQEVSLEDAEKRVMEFFQRNQ